MRITRLKLQNWRNFKDAEIGLSQRAFFVGPNASGKSNLLDALRFLRDIASVGGGLQEAVARRGGVGEIRCLAARRDPAITLEIDLGEDGEPAEWTYALAFGAGEAGRAPAVVRESVLKAGKAGKMTLVVERPTREDKADAERLTQTALEHVNANKEFREIFEFLRSVSYLHVVPETVRDPGRSAGRDDPFGGDLIERINRTRRSTRESRLRRMEEALRVAVPQLSNLELDIDERGTPHLRAKYNHWRPQGAWQRETRFSDGTLRLLGLIWSLLEPGGPLLLEEPENSLNAAVVAHLAPMIARATRRSRRQSLITTHSADLLSNAVDLEEIHLLQPSDDGTSVISAESLKEVQQLVESGVPVSEAVLGRTKSKDAGKLPLLELVGQ